MLKHEYNLPIAPKNVSIKWLPSQNSTRFITVLVSTPIYISKENNREITYWPRRIVAGWHVSSLWPVANTSKKFNSVIRAHTAHGRALCACLTFQTIKILEIYWLSFAITVQYFAVSIVLHHNIYVLFNINTICYYYQCTTFWPLCFTSNKNLHKAQVLY